MSQETESPSPAPTTQLADLPATAYRALLDSMSEGVSLATEAGIIVYTNPAEDRMFGYEHGELVGKHVSVQNAYPAQTNARIVAEVISELKRNGVWRGEWLNRRKDGSTFVSTAKITAVAVEGRTHWLCVQEDVTHERQQERELRDSESRLELATTAAYIGIWDWDLVTGRFVYSAQARRICGFGPDEEITFEKVASVTHPEDLPRTSAQARRALDPAIRDSLPYEYRLSRADGSVRHVIAHGEATFTDVDGETKATRYVGTLQDITERKDAELHQSVLAEIGRLTRDMDDPAEISFTAAAVLGRSLGVSRAGYGTIDKAAETITIERDWNAPGIRTLAGVLHFRDYGSYIEDLKRGETVVFENADLDPRTAATSAALKAISAQSVVNMPVTEHGGFVALLYLNHATARRWSEAELVLIKEVAEQTRIVVERRRAERRLREVNAQLEQRVERALAERRLLAEVVESTDARVHILDLRYRWLGINKAAAEEFQHIYGIRPRLGDCMLELLAHLPQQLEAAKALWDRALGGEEFMLIDEFGDPDIARRYYEMKFNVLRDRAGRRIGAFVFVYDVTERLHNQRRLAEAESALRQSQKMEAMGQLTGGVAHDFNNLLTPIIGGLDMLQRRLYHDERAQRMISGALTSAERAQTLVQRLLAFARRQPLQPVPVDVATLASSMGELIESTMGPNIRVTVQADADTPAAIADANQLEMALLNLAVNSRDAMPSGGSLTITVKERVLDAAELDLRPGSYVCLSVTDTGMGMDEATRARAIEPFFSTKGIGKGTGLGLSMVHGLASQLGGALDIQTQLGAGTRVELFLPVAESRPEAWLPEIQRQAHHGNSGRVALIDDEDLVRSSTSEMLKELGYAVIEFDSAQRAQRELDVHAIDLLITDHLMPGMNGADLARQLRRRRPELPILIISGYANVEGIASDLPRLTKPFRQHDLAASLSALLGSR